MTGFRDLRLFDLEQPRHQGAPIHPAHEPPGYAYMLHRRHEATPAGGRTGAAGVLITSEHAGTHIDALSHQAEDLKLFGGVATERVETSFGFRELGAETLPAIVARGLLIDLVRHRGGPVERGRWIELAEVREIVGKMPFLVPGVGAQGGDVALAVTNGQTHDGTGLIISSSRGILYAGTDDNFSTAARAAAQTLRDQINASRSSRARG